MRPLLRRGVTFTVYAESAGTERIFPFDPIPRIFSHQEWRRIADGVEQRVRALNAFLRDVYTTGGSCGTDASRASWFTRPTCSCGR